MWKSKSAWGCCLVGAYFLARYQGGGGYSGAAYKKRVYVGYKMFMLCMVYFFGVTIFVLNPFLLHSING